jgi:hypothetical protein
MIEVQMRQVQEVKLDGVGSRDRSSHDGFEVVERRFSLALFGQESLTVLFKCVYVILSLTPISIRQEKSCAGIALTQPSDAGFFPCHRALQRAKTQEI